MQQEKLQRIKEVASGFDAAASIQRETGAKRPRDDAPLLRQREKTVAALNHNLIASTHRNTKMDLPEPELRWVYGLWVMLWAIGRLINHPLVHVLC